MRKHEKNRNLLLMTPIRNTNIEWEKNKDVITLIIKRQSFMDKIMNKVFKTPKKVKIDLDDIGSFVWENCNGENNINDISKIMKNHFGDKVEPVIGRLVSYIKILRNNKFIEIY